MRVETRSCYIEHRTDQLDGFVTTNLIDYLVRSIPSDIKSAVAFLKWPSLAQTLNARLKFLYSLLIWRDGLARWRAALSLQLQLLYPAPQHRFANAD
jgi:hypothetical protein